MINVDSNTDKVIEADFLICGAGPAGASLACFLAQHGLIGIMIAAAPSTSDTPRAHITNMAALECLRDIGLDKECLKVATQSGCMEHTRWCHSMAGEEFGRIYSWGHDPQRSGDYDAASPCKHVDLPQTLLEPILVNYARNHGWDVRFNNKLLDFEQDHTRYISRIQDNVSENIYTVSSKYLFGCDGARSQVVRTLDLPLVKKAGGGMAINVLVECDMSHLVQYRVGNLHWIIQPEHQSLEYSAMCLTRMVRPWDSWMFIVFPRNPDTDVSQVTEAQWMDEVKRYIGDDSLPVKIVNVSTWKVNEIVAERYSEGNVFCLGDAVHRHPPFNGLGSNTCIQDAYNLAWKIAYVHQSKAYPDLLQSYTLERQPVGLSVITRANQGFRDHLHVWNALGITETDQQKRIQNFEELKAATAAGRRRRQDLHDAIEGTCREFHAVGEEMNQRYQSDAIFNLDEPSPVALMPQDPVLEYLITTYPGARLPHAWLNTRIPVKQISTIDLAGHKAFCLFTGIGGVRWKEAAKQVEEEMAIEVRAYSIGWCQDYEDVYGDWARRREIDEDGAVLVRPDRFVCWRSEHVVEDCVNKLKTVLRSVLGFES